MAKGTYEPEVMNIIKKNLTAGSVFIDVGANVGYFARMASDMVESSGWVYAFEIEHDNYYSLCKNTGPLNNVIPLHFAVSNGLTFMQVHHSSHSACHSLVNTGNYLDGDEFTVPTITMDYFWSNHLNKQRVDLIKIDVEGAELFVLEGMGKMLSENIVETMIIEYCPRILKNSGQDPKKFHEVLSSDFSLSIIEDKYRNLQKNKGIKDLNEFLMVTDHLLEQKDAENINLLCKRK
jgi:FkbM family methyltransferase